MPKKKTQRCQPATKTKKPAAPVSSTDIDAVLKRAGRHYRAGEYDDALDICRRAVAKAPQHFPALNLLGTIASRACEKALAADSFAKAAALNPTDAAAHINLGMALRNQGSLDTAIASYRRAINIDPDIAAAHNNLGNALKDQGNLDEALAAYRRATEADATYAEAFNTLGMVLRSRENRDDAIASFRRAVKINPGFAHAHNNLGHALGMQEKMDEAIASCRRALTINPDFADAHANLGHAYKRKEDRKRAIACYRRAVEIDPDLASAHKNLGDIFFDQGAYDDAAACNRRALEIDPRDADGLFNLSRIFAAQQKTGDAIASLRRVIEIDPARAVAHNDLGNLLKNEEKLDEAVACFERALEIDPDYGEVYNNLGIVRKAQDRTEDAITCYRRSIELRPENAEAHNNLGNTLKDVDLLDEAIASYRRAIEIRPNLVEAHCNLAKIHPFVPGDPEIDILKGLLGDKEVSAENRNHLRVALGKAFDDTGDYDQAFSHYAAANGETAKELPFDAERHRRAITAIKRVFRTPSPTAEAPGGDVYVPIFIIGMSRSGKSLVESVLAQHDEVFAAGENHAWRNALTGVLEKYGITAAFPKNVAALSEKQIIEIGDSYMIELSKLAPDARFFVNTMPSNYPYVGLIFRALPWAKVIYTYRDPLDNCLISYFYRYKTGNAYSYDLRNVASYCADYQEVMDYWHKLYGDRIPAVGYEDLVRSPDRVIPSLFSYCGLDYDPAAIHADFNGDEIGRWKNYDRHLGPMRDSLGEWARIQDDSEDPQA
jgi:tetratricopeptide (TPR) repeat protein